MNSDEGRPTFNSAPSNDTAGITAGIAELDFAAPPAGLAVPKVNLSRVKAEDAARAFVGIAGDGNQTISAQEVEGLCSQLVSDGLTEPMLATIASMTDGLDVVSFRQFYDILTAVLTHTTNWGQMKTPVAGYVGFDSLGQQIHKKSLRRGFEFNILVVGESGLGKSTLINTLFRAAVSRRPADELPVVPKTVAVETITHVVEENGVRLKVSITDTPGFGDLIKNTGSFDVIDDFLMQQFEQYLENELAVKRQRHISDTRVHCCLYFIAPTGHRLKPLDIACMKRLHTHCNLIPVIGKADTMTPAERDSFKTRIREDLQHAGIKVYLLDTDDEHEDDATANDAIRNLMPFAVVGSNTEKTVGNTTTRGRATRFGFVDIENPAHCDFAALRDVLLRTHTEDLKETTNFVHYESFRQHRLDPTSEAF